MRLDLTVIEILLLGYGLFYGSFVATSAIFYSQEFAVPLAIGLPIVMLCGWSLVRKPFRTIVVVGVLSWIAMPVISQWADPEPQGLAAQAAVVANPLGMPLPLVTQWPRARRKRHALEDRSPALSSSAPCPFRTPTSPDQSQAEASRLRTSTVRKLAVCRALAGCSSWEIRFVIAAQIAVNPKF